MSYINGKTLLNKREKPLKEVTAALAHQLYNNASKAE